MPKAASQDAGHSSADRVEVTFDADEAFVNGYIPLDQLEKSLKALLSGKKGIEAINFKANGYCTDAVLKLIGSSLTTALTENLSEINLLGCSLVTDVGLSWLAKILQEDSYVTVKLDGCSKVTDAGLATLKTACPKSQVSAMATSIVHLRNVGQTKGCPCLSDPNSHSVEEKREAQVLIVPLKTQVSTATYLQSQKAEPRKNLHYMQHCSLKDWTVNLLEADPQTPLFEHLVAPNLTQVLVPFDASCDPAEVRSHIANTIALVLSKETINPAHPTVETSTASAGSFFDRYICHKCILTHDGVFRSITNSEKVLGMVVSRQPLSRTNPCYQVECLSQTKPEETGLVLGIMHDVLMGDRFPMESKERSGGAVEGFELEPGAVYGFGVEGEWLSEYVPGEKAVYYCTKNGEKMEEKKISEKPHIGMYPMLSVLGRQLGEVRINQFLGPSESQLSQYEAKKQYWPHEFSHNILFDEDGILSYGDNYKSPGEVALFVTSQEITQKYNSCTIKVLSLGAQGTITLGIGPEDYKLNRQPGWDSNSVALHGDNGDGSVPEKGAQLWRVGDTITATVTGFNGDYIQSGETVTVHFAINGKQVTSSTGYQLKYEAPSGVRCVFLIGMHSKGEKVQLCNYRPLHFPQSPRKNMLTMGRSHFMNPMDDGTLTYSKFDKREFFGLFVSKTPISADLPYFEFEVVKCSDKRHIGIGLCHPLYPTNEMLGWRLGSIGYHADNGQVYHNTSSGYASKDKSVDASYGPGDIVGCGVDIKKAKLKEDGTLKPQQMLTVYFTKNGKRTHEREFEYLSEGLYPGINLHYEGDELKMRNYYPGPETLHAVQDKPKEKKAKGSTFVEGCHFLVVGVGSEKVDAKGKTELVSQMFNAESDLSTLKHLHQQIAKLESNLGSLDLQGQERYKQLLWQLECLERFVKTPQRLSFLSLNTGTGEGCEEVISHIVRTLEMDLEHHHKLHELNGSVWKYLEEIRSVLAKKHVLMAEDLSNLVSNETFVGDGRVCEQAVRFLQKKGYLACLPMKNSVIALDMKFVVSLTSNIEESPRKQLGSNVPGLGSGASAWGDEIAIYPEAKSYDSQRMRLLRWALQFFGVMRTPSIRMQTTDPMYLFFTLDSLGDASLTLDDFVDRGENSNLVMMRRTYHFLHDLSTSFLAFILTRCARFSRIVLLRPNGGVFQSGAVQTRVQRKVEGKECTLTLESYCYMPSMEGEALNSETRLYVEEYTWNIFCILADIIDVALIKLDIPVIVSDNCPPNLINTSIGCIHDWHSPVDEDDRQTVCTLCNLCCEHSSKCPYKGIANQQLRQSACGTKVTGCKDCGICKNCADELWTVRSFLRPCCEVSSNACPRNQKAVHLNSTTFDEVECTNFDTRCTPVCLKTDAASDSLIQVFPGPAVEVPNVDRLEQYNKQASYPRKFAFSQGDMVTVKLDPLKVSQEQLEAEEEEEVLEIKPVYHTLFCRETRVWHDTGILCYDSSSTSVPVSEFVGQRPLSPECNKFSFEIINEGESRYIAIGLCHRRYPPNRQPGWDQGSIGYHADDGGIYLGSGWPSSRKKQARKGDIMSVELDFDELKATFRLNNEAVYQTGKLRMPAGGFYPMVGMHSVGEAVRLREKTPWLPSKEEEAVHSLPDAFDCYKYGNLWISPGRKVDLVTKKGQLYGWVNLHNPSRNVIGYEVTNNVGTLKPGESITFYMNLKTDEVAEDKELWVKWLQVDAGREYTAEDITMLHNSATSESLLSHSLALKVVNTQLTDVSLLKKTSDGEPDSSVRYSLEVFKNGISVEKYWLKGGNYNCILPFNTSAIFRYPKFPTLDVPNTMHRGMRLVAQPGKDIYAECVVVGVINGGKNITLEYSEANSENNSQIDLPLSSPVIQLKEIPYETIVRAKPLEKKGDQADGQPPESKGDKPDEKQSETEVQAALEILGYHPRGNVAAAKGAYMFAPFHLLTEASQQAIKALDSNWLHNSLRSVAVCRNIPTRLTVQEQQITFVSREPSTWVNGNNSFKQQIGETFAYLPARLDFNKLCYPRIPAMFTDIEVHRLCLLVDQLSSTGWDGNTIDVPIHFVDIPPNSPSDGSPLPDELKYGCMLSGWTYTSLIAKKLLLPNKCKQVFSGGLPDDVPRHQLEKGMASLLSVYTSLCHIYAEQRGGLEYQIPYESGTSVVISSFAKPDDHLVDMSKHTQQMENSNVLFRKKQYVGNQSFISTICKAHALCQEPVSAPQNSLFRMEFFDPYGETVNVLDRCLPKLTQLPPEFFTKFTNLQVFSLHECDKLVALRDSAIKELPADMFEIPEMMCLEVMNLPLTTLPNRVPASSWLTKLKLSGLQLQELPSSLGNLTELTELDLNYNLLTSLPMELANLQRLKVLHLCGMPWLSLEGSKVSFPLDKYMSWLNEHPYLRTFLGDEKILKLFHEFDHNKNAMLDEDEIASLNSHLFWEVPRIGSKDISDDEYGGIPPVIFTLLALEELYLDYQAVTTVPVHMCRLQNLSFLSLAHNPLLESLPGSLGHLPSLKAIRLVSCPSLRTPPNEVVSRGFESIKAYLKRLAGGFTECRRTKLMFVGLGGAGKTSLLRALMSVGKKTEGTKGEDITDGIVIQPWTVKSDSGVEVTYNTWDFAGQTLYYNTHQFFLSKRAVYLLLWSTRQGFEHAGLDFWLSSVASHAPKTPIFVVGTHCDQVPKAEVPMNELKRRYPQIAGFHFVSSLEGTGIKELESDLLRVTLEQKNMGEKVPQVWLNLEKKILASRTSTSFLEWQKIKDFGMEVGIYDEKDIREAIQFLHELGTVQYFDNDFLRNIVVINPQWIDHKGRFLRKDVPTIWNTYPPDLHTWLLQLTEEFDLTFPLPKEDVNIVPCLLPQEEPAELSWCVCPRPENIIFLVHEVIESLIEESFHGVSYDYLIPCPDCVMKEGTLEPSMFEGTLVKRAKEHPAPFLQCRKYFHTISMAQLQEVMPADSASDFDAHLQHSIMALQQLNSDMAKDVAILYSAWDVPANAETDKVHPAWIHEDLQKEGEKEGFTCWYPEDVENTSVEDMMLALKNCKVVVALVSDNFERDSKSNDMLMYTMDTLGKQYVIVVIRPSLAWQSSNLGMRIGKDELMVMVKTKDRYKGKVDNMLNLVKEKLNGVRMSMAQHPAVFISYCWSNSRDAQKKGTQCPPSALGWGDPREIKAFLEKKDITCWLDIEQTGGGGGLFKNITQGMRQSRVLVACVSDEYVKSDNCMMELRFGVLNLNLPLVVCVVGTGREWKASEVGILMHRSKASKVYFQQENDSAHDTLLQYRKFMRHIISYISSIDSTPMPRLLVVDFDRQMVVTRTSKTLATVDEPSSESSRSSSTGRPTLRPKTATRTRERIDPVNILEDEENWEAENFCLKVLCENEEGWHMCKQIFPMKLDEEFKRLLKGCSAYLARLYAILQQSSVQLTCFAGPRGKKYRKWIEDNAVETPNFIDAYSTLRGKLRDNIDSDAFLGQLCRCHLPSGKTYWLCEGHQDGPRITKLSTESASRDEVRRVLFEEDIRLKELLVASDVYKRKKGQHHGSIVLPSSCEIVTWVLMCCDSKNVFGVIIPSQEKDCRKRQPQSWGVHSSSPQQQPNEERRDAASGTINVWYCDPITKVQKASLKATASTADVVNSAVKRRENNRNGSGKDGKGSKACSVQ
ncbi:hypothetical protein BaRGS_00022822 [Batillaria attramentaria]|uniref:non-specific serine/threonine protein kinase n=1 Tax=Batillaria attramentaria TaxID=370345 RepID=A0ABD0KFY6_9CAEN